MRLPEFILANVEPILMEWEGFARSIWPGDVPGPEELRDDAEAILRATVTDMQSEQSSEAQTQKSRGAGSVGEGGVRVDRASETHAAGRVGSGFDLATVVAEYRALRASVIRLWRDSEPSPDLNDLDDLTRFNESIDQSLTHAVGAYMRQVERERQRQLTTEKALRAQAEEASRAKDMFLATLSHEIRTPLNAIVGWLPILRAQDCDDDDLAEGLDAIERNAKAQVKLIDEVLDISRIISGKLRVEPRPCNLAKVVMDGVDAVRPAADARNITLDVRVAPVASQASCDAMRIQQVVWNLVSNAVKFTSKGGRVDVTLDRYHSSHQIQVRDNGRGMDPALLPHVFDRFRQADSSTRRKFSGLGLGLSIVKSLVEAHGGTVEAHSAGEGHGSTFTVRLPIRAVQSEDQGPPPDSKQAAGDAQGVTEAGDAEIPLPRLEGVRVLVVDDEADARRLLARLLVRLGAVVGTAQGVEEALENLPRFKPHVLISDLGMPGQDGFDLIREVRRGHSAGDLPAIALTAFAGRDHERHVLEAGYQVHVDKPVNPHELTAAIARLAGSRRT